MAIDAKTYSNETIQSSMFMKLTVSQSKRIVHHNLLSITCQIRPAMIHKVLSDNIVTTSQLGRTSIDPNGSTATR